MEPLQIGHLDLELEFGDLAEEAIAFGDDLGELALEPLDFGVLLADEEVLLLDDDLDGLGGASLLAGDAHRLFTLSPVRASAGGRDAALGPRPIRGGREFPRKREHWAFRASLGKGHRAISRRSRGYFARPTQRRCAQRPLREGL